MSETPQRIKQITKTDKLGAFNWWYWFANISFNMDVCYTKPSRCASNEKKNLYIAKKLAGLGFLTIALAISLLFASCDLNNAFLLAIHLNVNGSNVASAAKIQLSVALEPPNAPAPDLRWLSSDPAIATVDQKGMVTGVSAGVATITVKTADGLKADSCSMAVWGKDSDNTHVVFKCANPKYYGWSYWYEPPGQSAASTLSANPITAVLAKSGGSNTGGYGLLFAYKDEKNYYKLLIKRTQEYSLRKMQDGVDSVLINWTKNYANLKANDPNTVEISKSNGELSLKFNGVTVSNYADPSFDAGTVAFFAEIDKAGAEDLANNPVAIQYLMTSPAQIP